MRAMKCPNCGTESNGAFCSECGAPMKGAKCRECSAALVTGANFCTSCGTPVRGGAGATSNTPWIITGVALVALIAVLLWPALSGRGSKSADEGRVPISQMENVQSVGTQAESEDAGGGGSPPQLTGSPREQADRLFNRIMTERAGGDTARAKFFLPMGIQAYGMAGELDADGLYHLSLLQIFGADYKAARETAEKILSKDPTHLLGLSAAQDAAMGEGDKAAAAKYAKRFLSAYDSEMKKTKEEYQDHARMMPELKKSAEAIAR